MNKTKVNTEMNESISNKFRTLKVKDPVSKEESLDVYDVILPLTKNDVEIRKDFLAWLHKKYPAKKYGVFFVKEAEILQHYYLIEQEAHAIIVRTRELESEKDNCLELIRAGKATYEKRISMADFDGAKEALSDAPKLHNRIGEIRKELEEIPGKMSLLIKKVRGGTTIDHKDFRLFASAMEEIVEFQKLRANRIFYYSHHLIGNLQDFSKKVNAIISGKKVDNR